MMGNIIVNVLNPLINFDGETLLQMFDEVLNVQRFETFGKQ